MSVIELEANTETITIDSEKELEEDLRSLVQGLKGLPDVEDANLLATAMR